MSGPDYGQIATETRAVAQVNPYAAAIYAVLRVGASFLGGGPPRGPGQAAQEALRTAGAVQQGRAWVLPDGRRISAAQARNVGRILIGKNPIGGGGFARPVAEMLRARSLPDLGGSAGASSSSSSSSSSAPGWYGALWGAAPRPLPKRKRPARRRPVKKPKRKPWRPPRPRVPKIPVPISPDKFPGVRWSPLAPNLLRILSPLALLLWPSKIGKDRPYEAPTAPPARPIPPQAPSPVAFYVPSPDRRPTVPRPIPAPRAPAPRPAPPPAPAPRPPPAPGARPAPPRPAARPLPKPAAPKPKPLPMPFLPWSPPSPKPKPRPGGRPSPSPWGAPSSPTPLTALGPQPVGLPQPQLDPEPEQQKCEQVARRRRRKGQCRQGYFREYPDRTTYTTWSTRTCQSSRKKPALRLVR